MSDAPERILIVGQEKNWFPVQLPPGMEDWLGRKIVGETEYIRADVAVAMVAQARRNALIEASEIAHHMATTEANMSKPWRNGCMDAGNELLTIANA